MQPDVLVVGGGPAGLASAIAAAQKGFRVTVVDSRKPPINKPCGEGLLPEAVGFPTPPRSPSSARRRLSFRRFSFRRRSIAPSALPFRAGRPWVCAAPLFIRLLIDRASETAAWISLVGRACFAI